MKQDGGEIMLEKLIQYALLNHPRAVAWIKKHAWWLCSLSFAAAVEALRIIFC